MGRAGPPGACEPRHLLPLVRVGPHRLFSEGRPDGHAQERGDRPDPGIGGQRLPPPDLLSRHRAHRRPNHPDRPQQHRYGTQDLQPERPRSRRRGHLNTRGLRLPDQQVLPRPRPHPPRRREPRGADVLKRGLLEDRSPFVPPLHRNLTIFPGDTPPFPWYNASITNPKVLYSTLCTYDEDNARDVPRTFAPHALAMGDSGSDGLGLRGVLPLPFEPLGLHPADPG